jgi:hypothetical protein
MAETRTPRPRVVIVGGGLAGMTTARELSRRGFEVVVLEAAERLGGKAGANQVLDPVYNERMVWEDHGYHVIPGWYVNTRRLLKEIGCEHDLIPLDRFHHYVLVPGRERPHHVRQVTMHEWSTWSNLRANLRNGLLPWHETVLSYYFLLDLAAMSFSKRSFLDRISANGFLHGRPYATERIAMLHHQSALQGSAIPYYEISAMTMQKLVRAWFKTPSPLVSILNGNLQEKFIEPFARELKARGVTVMTGVRVKGLRFSRGGQRVTGVQQAGGRQAIGGDYIVLATPHRQTFELLCSSEYAVWDRRAPASDRMGLFDLAHLRSAPMAALHVYFASKVSGLPREHVMLAQSRFGLSFIDLTEHWKLDHTVLSCIASNFEPLRHLDPKVAVEHLVAELFEYLPFDPHELDFAYTLQPHVETPLFLNTSGSWHFRPASKEGTGVENLFVAGDYCRSEADLTTMESAIWSGIGAARAILDAAHIPSDLAPEKIPQFRPLWLWLARLALLPYATLVGVPLHVWERRAVYRARLWEYLGVEPVAADE